MRLVITVQAIDMQRFYFGRFPVDCLEPECLIHFAGHSSDSLAGLPRF